KNRKYRLLFSHKLRKKPGPKGPGPEIIAAVVEMKKRNPTWGCPRIAQQIALAFDIQINKDVVRRILAARYQLERCFPHLLLVASLYDLLAKELIANLESSRISDPNLV